MREITVINVYIDDIFKNSSIVKKKRKKKLVLKLSIELQFICCVHSTLVMQA